MIKQIATAMILALMFGTSGSSAQTAAETRAERQYKAWHWYELTDQQDVRLTTALRGMKHDKPVNVLCADADCRGLAKDFVDAFEAAGWKANMVASGFIGNEKGFHCSHKDLCSLITKATGIPTKVMEMAPDGVFTIMFGPKK